MNRKDTVRGCIIIRWKATGSPVTIEYEQVLSWAKECCRDFGKRGINPAPEFMGQMERSNSQYVKNWLKGCRFPFHIVDDGIDTLGIQRTERSPMQPPIIPTPTTISGWRVCLKCGRLNLVDAVFCSYCGQSMPKDIK